LCLHGTAPEGIEIGEKVSPKVSPEILRSPPQGIWSTSATLEEVSRKGKDESQFTVSVKVALACVFAESFPMPLTVIV
jgi:hypothetical protein